METSALKVFWHLLFQKIIFLFAYITTKWYRISNHFKIAQRQVKELLAQKKLGSLKETDFKYKIQQELIHGMKSGRIYLRSQHCIQ